MRVSVHVGPTTVQIEAPASVDGRHMIGRLRAAMVEAQAVSHVMSQAPAVAERLYASPAAGITTQELAVRVRAWLGKVGCEVVGVVSA